MIALMTDFGLDDIYVGVMKSVILSIDPDARLIDLSHSVPPHDVEAGAFLLAAAWSYLPSGTVGLCVVDPGVGGPRRPVAVAVGDSFFVGPDDGLLSFVLAERRATGAVELDKRKYHLSSRTGDTFHGRDVFAPVAAHLHRGAPSNEIGTAIELSSLVRIRPSAAAFADREIVASVKLVDRFGNLILDLASAAFNVWMGAQTAARIEVRDGWSGQASIVHSYASVARGEVVLAPNSFGRIEIAVREGRACDKLGGIGPGAVVYVRR